MPNPTSSPVIIVTGASKGLGLSITKILLNTFGARVIAVSRTLSDELKGVGSESGMMVGLDLGSGSASGSTSASTSEQAQMQDPKQEEPPRSIPSNPDGSSSSSSSNLIFIQGDVTDPSTSAKAVDTALTQWGRLDGLVLNAGTIDPLGPISDPSNTPTQWSESFTTNLFSLVSMVQCATPHLRGPSVTVTSDQSQEGGRGRGGNVVFVSSGAATGNTAGWGCYNATKAALNSLCRTYANEERSIASFAVRPGMVDTDMQTKLRANGGKGMLPEEMERFVNAHKEGKLLKPEDPGYVIAALAVKGQEVHDLSGQFLSWNDATLAAYQRTQ